MNNRKKESIQVAPFQIRDCALIVQICDQLPAINLRELRERIADLPEDSLYHHFCETVLRPSFDDPEFHNDFSIWARHTIHDHVLAERLGILDPYSFSNMEELRKEVLDIFDDRLSELHFIPWAVHDRAFHFRSATTVVFNTSMTIETPKKLCEAIKEMTTSSLYYHFWEARRRIPDSADDFSIWLGNWDSRVEPLIEALSQIDFYFYSLRELQAKLCQVVNECIGSGKCK